MLPSFFKSWMLSAIPQRKMLVFGDLESWRIHLPAADHTLIHRIPMLPANVPVETLSLERSCIVLLVDPEPNDKLLLRLHLRLTGQLKASVRTRLIVLSDNAEMRAMMIPNFLYILPLHTSPHEIRRHFYLLTSFMRSRSYYLL